MTQPLVTVGVYIILCAKRPLIQDILRALIDDRTLVATKWQTVLFVLKKILAHFRSNFFEQVSQMRRDRIVAQHRVALLREIANAEQGERAEDQQRDEDQIERLVIDDPDPKKQRRHHGANRKNDVAWRERKHQRFHGTPQAVSAILLFMVATWWSGFDIRDPPRRKFV